MGENLRIVFMGTPEFAVATLDALIAEGYNVVGVITAPDRPAGRGRHMHKSAVKQYALKKGLPVLQPKNLKNEIFQNALNALEPDLQIVVAFRMLPRSVWGLPEYGTFNLHASLLPQYRGAAPINWAIINGETETGVSTFFIDEKIDTGAMIMQESTPIFPGEDAGSLHDRLMKIGSELVLKTVKLIAGGDVDPQPQQEHANLKPAPKLTAENCRIDWQADTVTIYDHIRGLSPYPAAWTILINGDQELRVKIYRASMINKECEHETGLVYSENNEIYVACKDGYISIEEIQLPGKRRMQVKDLLNGYEILAEAKML